MRLSRPSRQPHRQRCAAISLEPNETKWIGKVLAFRHEISNKGLVADYADHESFADVVRPHLFFVLGGRFSNRGTVKEAAERTTQLG